MEEKTIKGNSVNLKNGMSTDKKVIISIITVVLVIALGLFGWFYYANNLRAVVKFDGGSLTVSEFSMYYKAFAPQYEYYQYPAEEIPELIANEAAANKILLLKAEQEGFKLKNEDKKEIDDMFKDEDRRQSMIDAGIDPDQMIKIYYNDAVINEYLNKVKEDFTEEEVIAYLKDTYDESVNMTEYVTRHILFLAVDDYGAPLEDDKKAEKKTEAEGVLAKALAGEDFAKLAVEYSEDEQTAKVGGLYNVYLDERTDKAYTEATKNLNAGSITTALVESTYGYHIIKLDKKNDNGRVNSDYDRLSMAYKKVDEIRDAMNMKINEKVLASIVESITGIKLDTSSDHDHESENTGTDETQIER